MRISRGKIIAIAAGVVVMTGATFALRPERLAVDTALVARGPIETTVDADGRTRVRDRYAVTAPVAGRLLRLDLAEGAIVRAGDVVAHIAPIPIDAQTAEQARSRLDGALALAREADSRIRITRDLAEQRRHELDRARQLFAVGALAPRDTETAWLAWRQTAEDQRAASDHATAAEADIRQARAALMALGFDAAGNDARTTVIRAPVSARVLRVPERSERVVAAGTPILELGDPRSLEVVVDVLSSDGAMIAAGQCVRLDRWGGTTPLTGVVRLVEPAGFTKVSALGVDEQRVNVIVDVPDGPASLGDGFRVEARIVTWSAASAVVVPASALVREGSAWSVYVVDGQRARKRQLRVGHMGDATAEVLAGLKPGDEVVLFPSDKIADDVRIEARRP
jgi:HlyD family secretion protein